MAARRFTDLLFRALASLAALIGIAFLVWILYVVLARGLGAINWDFFTERPAPPGMAGGGVGSAILGTLLMTGLAMVIGVPTGLLAGVYLAEFGQHNKFGEWVRFTCNMLMGTPSIIIGVFVYIILVMPMKNFSGYAGAVAMAVIMLPVVTRTTEDMLTLVPSALRESALALGAPRWKVTLGVVFRAARNGLITGILLAVARVSGETAPLLFTALNSPYWPESLNEPISNLTVTIFNYAMSPYPDWQAMAWGASFLITAGVLGATLFTRTLLWLRSHKS
ncbi:phosphate ABC transporter membrane protein PstA [Desulfuromonas sp. DDH964]|nr:phosphate ABC transporter permease PstA [Desulfuromonas sp. DDH964]AMV70988.1 phosphate ABC transporter membrane protein PstA [Desulfuromonas sp. DDH964]